MADVPLKPLHPTDQDPPCPAYAEDASSAAAAESQPFITLSERDIEAAAPPAYVENQDDSENADGEASPFKGKSVPVRVLLCLMSMLLFAVGIGGLLTLFIVFFKILVLVWTKLGLL
ncbi:uncharacterized protein GGS22DRAFT_172242 [Annulohypoxylon maeteangense]|uniref:uncharacterized protein n=1 Tax=Annulohypoxylon maeteangense TaxID=1927788 RepID=UPI002008C325|nr:uncharacterized protein GGS22DRAFT_172242 [Annulohypoxylon maeteangense]KAI0881472.1 hypothetical protein GGS22DRAFT_172242 [Annulohypoxylon maeteangense]